MAMRQLLITAISVLTLAACGGGGPTGNTTTTPPPGTNTGTPSSSAKTATVGVLLTDGAGTQWDQAWATITSIELIGATSRATIFSGRETIDLLSLADYSELFTVADGVAPGMYSKIRLRVERLELVDLSDAGVELRRVPTTLVGNGKIDINPRGPFAVAGGDTLLIEIDFDMHKSFKTTETGNGRTILRPVVFATIKNGGTFNRLTRVSGVVASIDTASQSFVLCQTALTANVDFRRHYDDDDARHCLDVTTDAKTGVFDANGLPVTVNDVVVDDELTAVGFLRRPVSDDEDDDDVVDPLHRTLAAKFEDDFTLAAVTLELGANFGRLAGTLATDLVGERFDFRLAAGQGFAADSVIPTQTFPTTRIFSKTGTELDALALDAGTNAVVDGVIRLGSGANDDLLRAALIVLDLAPPSAEQLLRGQVTSVNTASGTLQLLVGTADRCVNARNAEIFLISDKDGLESRRGQLADLKAGQRADVYGVEGIDGCFVASDILADDRP